MSTVVTQRMVHTTTAQRVQKELLWNEETYQTFYFENGIAYLLAYFSGDESLVSIVSMRREFWSWWRGHWNGRDEVYVESLDLEHVSLRYRLELYRGLHNAHMLAAELAPNRIVLGPYFPTKKTLVCR